MLPTIVFIVGCLSIEAGLFVATMRLRFPPHYATGPVLFVVAAFWAFAGNTILTFAFDLYDLWGHPPPSWVAVSIALIGLATLSAGAGVVVFQPGRRVAVTLIGCLTAGLYGSLATVFRVYDSAYNDNPVLSHPPDHQANAVMIFVLPVGVLIAVFGLSVLAREGRRLPPPT